MQCQLTKGKEAPFPYNSDSMPDKTRLTIALPLAPQHVKQIRDASDKFEVTNLSRMQRHVYREGRPLWPGYSEPPLTGEESEENATQVVAEVLGETEVLLTNPTIPTETLLGRAPGLKWLQLTSAGVDRLAQTDLVRSGRITVTTASGIHAIPISEYVIGAMIAFAKGFPRAAKQQSRNQWQGYISPELAGATVGILGLGAIGRRVAQLAKALGMRVIAVRRSAEQRTTGEEAGDPCFDVMVPASELHYVLAESDYIVLSVPLTDDTQHMIGEAELRAMKPNAVIVNIARGAVIDQPALIAALKSGAIAGAALDVTDPEPLPVDHELWSLENVMITPHISGGTPRYMDRAVDLFCDNIRRYQDGETLINVVDVARGY